MRKELTTDAILKIKYSQIIKDPFLEHSEWNRNEDIFRYQEKPREISIWEAYQKGYEKAYNEILEFIVKKEL